MHFLTIKDGVRAVRIHPGWMVGEELETARLLTPDELVDHGFGLMIVDDMPEYDHQTHYLVENPIDTWPTTERTATRTYSVVAFPPAPLGPITPRQLRLTLLSIGTTEADVDALLVDDPAGMIEWKHATMFVRDHPLVEALAVAIGLPPEQVDALWRYAQDIK